MLRSTQLPLTPFLGLGVSLFVWALTGCGPRPHDQGPIGPPADPTKAAIDLGFSASDVGAQTDSFRGSSARAPNGVNLTRKTNAPLQLPRTDGKLTVAITFVQPDASPTG